MTAKIQSYNSLSHADISATIDQVCRGIAFPSGYLAEVVFTVKGELAFAVVDDPRKVAAFCKKHNIPITPDDRTGVEVYLDNLKVAE